MGMLLMVVLALLVLRALSGPDQRRGSVSAPALWPSPIARDGRRAAASGPREEAPEQMLQRLYVDGLLTDAEYEEKLYALFSKA